VFAVFRSALEAVASAAEAQRAMAGADWPEGADVRVRMGLHEDTCRAQHASACRFVIPVETMIGLTVAAIAAVVLGVRFFCRRSRLGSSQRSPTAG